ncbi:MAG TPA: type II toxin-antitoxin system VapC family toxin, partial [Opitutaceae bacterium]|nr:type II toxin-antitoxin system VapC family toxin [Opitutaceae bacterium]
MSLAAIPSGQSVLVDANVLLYHATRASIEASDFLGRCGKGDLIGVVTSVVVAEFCHRRMMLEASQAGLTGSNPARTLAQRPDSVRSLSRYRDEVRDLFDGGLVFEPVLQEDFLLGLELQRRHGLLANDSLNLAAAGRLA